MLISRNIINKCFLFLFPQSSQNRLYIKRARVVNADSIQTNVDIYIEDGVIKFIGSTADSVVPGGVKVIDVAGKYVLPGGVDPNTQFVAESNGEAPADDFYAGTKASVAGGTTTIIDLILPQKGESLIEAYDTWRSKADGKAVCDYGLRCGVTWYVLHNQRDHSIRFPFSIVFFQFTGGASPLAMRCGFFAKRTVSIRSMFSQHLRTFISSTIRNCTMFLKSAKKSAA